MCACAQVWSKGWLICMGVLRKASNSPHTGLLLSTSSKTLPTTAPGMVSTSRHAAISTRDQQGQMGADWYSGGISLGPFHSLTAAVRIYCLHMNS